MPECLLRDNVVYLAIPSNILGVCHMCSADAKWHTWRIVPYQMYLPSMSLGVGRVWHLAEVTCLAWPSDTLGKTKWHTWPKWHTWRTAKCVTWLKWHTWLATLRADNGFKMCNCLIIKSVFNSLKKNTCKCHSVDSTKIIQWIFYWSMDKMCYFQCYNYTLKCFLKSIVNRYNY